MFCMRVSFKLLHGFDDKHDRAAGANAEVAGP